MKTILLAFRRKWLKQISEVQKYLEILLIISGSWVILATSPNWQCAMIVTLFYVFLYRFLCYFISDELLIKEKHGEIVEIISEMKKNSDCWSIYNMVGDTERKEELHQKNIVLAKNITKISNRKVIMDRWGSWHWDHESGPILY